MTDLFTPYTLRGTTLRNRIVVSPMCQYMAVDGVVNDWHHAHYAALARGGSGLVVVEATAVSPEGRITPGCLGLWNDAQAEAFRPLVRAMRDAGAVPGIQIAHAGRKASANRPWEGDDSIAADDPRGWETIAPSALAFGAGLPKVPRAMTVADITHVRQDFVAAAKRARDVGFGWLMLHFAHGYLGQSFLSPHSNQRDDSYGGSLENRARFLVETLLEVRAIWPENRPLSARLGMIEFDGQDEQTLQDAITVARIFRESGLDFLDVSIGFSTPAAKIPWGPSFMAPVARRVRQESGLPVATSWYLGNAQTIDGLIRAEQIDLAMIGRPLLENPHWPYAAARALGREDAPWVLPAPYAHWLSRYRSL